MVWNGRRWAEDKRTRNSPLIYIVIQGLRQVKEGEGTVLSMVLEFGSDPHCESLLTRLSRCFVRWPASSFDEEASG